MNLNHDALTAKLTNDISNILQVPLQFTAEHLNFI